MCTKNDNPKNSTKAEQKEAVGLMGLLGATLNSNNSLSKQAIEILKKDDNYSVIISDGYAQIQPKK